jgi:hypothetical protein
MITYDIVKISGEVVATISSKDTAMAHIMAWAINARAKDFTDLVSIVEVAA